MFGTLLHTGDKPYIPGGHPHQCGGPKLRDNFHSLSHFLFTILLDCISFSFAQSLLLNVDTGSGPTNHHILGLIWHDCLAEKWLFAQTDPIVHIF